MENFNRHSIRLKEYDYSQFGYYYVTICTKDREMLFGNVVNGKMVLNRYGEIVDQIVKSLIKRFPVDIDICQIMPNHIHMIIIVGVGFSDPTSARFSSQIAESKPTLGDIVAYFKYQSTKQINEYIDGRENSNAKGREDPAPTYKKYKKMFQRNYYEHIIRGESELNEIREYTKTNPEMWDRDRNNPEFITNS